MTEFGRDRMIGRFRFGGMKLSDPADALPDGKYAIAVNVRAYEESQVRTRPGQSLLFTAPSGAGIVSMRAYTNEVLLAPDDYPRLLAVDTSGNVILDTGTNIGSVGSLGTALGASMIPFRPAQSPNPYMYISTPYAYNKYSSPDALNSVTENKVGIAEPSTPCSAGIDTTQFYKTTFGSANPGWTNAGTAAAATNGTRITDTVAAVFQDPAPGVYMWSLQVSTSVVYQKWMPIQIAEEVTIVTDVFPPLLNAIGISAIYYFSGSAGRCLIVLAGPQPGAEGNVKGQNVLAGLRRGALIKVGSEVCYVWSATGGPDGAVCVETSTASAHTTADTVTGVAAIQVPNLFAVSDAIQPADVTYQVTAGIGTQTATISVNPFLAVNFGFGPQDYITLGILVDDLANLTETKFLIDVGDGSFTQNFYYYSIRPSDIAAAVANSETQLSAAQYVLQRAVVDEELAATSGSSLVTTSGAQTPPGSGQWAQILIPIGALTRVGNDDSKTLQNAGKMQFLWNASGTINVATPVIMVFGGSEPDVGDVGAGYRYRARPRSRITGVVGNPSPDMRYGVNSRRMTNIVNLPDPSYDSQIDTWDIFRFGGSVNSWQFIGQVPSTQLTFSDGFSDDAAQAGAALDFDNFEPWPSIDVPFSATATTLCGTIAIATINPAGNVARFLPGNLIRFSDGNVYTLRERPVSLGSEQWRFELVECASYGTNVPMQIYEPAIARQFLPYLWGVDAAGTMFACGDPLRQGTLYFAKNYAPDSAPDSYNIEISPPSEPLMGGEVVDGLSYVASTERWWALYPQPDNPAQRYNVVQQPTPRGCIAPIGHCNDGRAFYWWAKDGIWSSEKGSLTDDDLYPLFPHEGIEPRNITYGGVTIVAPSYGRSSTFRLSYANYYLYATYVGLDGGYHTLVYDTRKGTWAVDSYSPEITCAYQAEQQAGSLLSYEAAYPVIFFGSYTGKVSVQQDLSNDVGGAISAVLATRELDGGDVRAPKQWGDMFLDLTPAAAVGVTPMGLNTAVESPVIIPASAFRQRVPLSFAKILVEDFLGLLLQWTDDYSVQTAPTLLNIWQTSWVIQPAKALGLYTFGTSFSWSGYGHLKQIGLAWLSTAPIILTATAYDGTSPAAITIPSSGGAYQKAVFNFTFNKGLLYKFTLTSSEPFQAFLDDSELWVGQWGRESAYEIVRGLGGRVVDSALV